MYYTKYSKQLPAEAGGGLLPSASDMQGKKPVVTLLKSNKTIMLKNLLDPCGGAIGFKSTGSGTLDKH
jgi:hypothetical protein